MKIDFIGIGAEKCATRWLGKCLSEHPEICLGRENGGSELFFFNEYDPHLLKIKNSKYYWGLKWYLKQFDHCPAKSVKGEISPTYLYSKESVKRIIKHFPEAKILVCLRDPTKRALSQYLHDIKIGITLPLGFERALKKNKTYIEKGKYYKYLKEYLHAFGSKRVHVILVDEIEKNPKKVVKEVYKFLNLKNTEFEPKNLHKRTNVAKTTKFPLLNYILIQTEYLIKRYNLWWLLKISDNLGIRKCALNVSHNINTKPFEKYPKMKSKTRTWLKRKYLKDINQLEKLIKKDLSTWK